MDQGPRASPGNPNLPANEGSWPYFLAVLAGVAAGAADVVIEDLLFTALLVLASCMLLGILRPRAPWRWVLLVAALIPLAELAAYAILRLKPSRGQVYGSLLTALPGFAGAYGGAVMRRVLDHLRAGH
jgi:hypothetical protein